MSEDESKEECVACGDGVDSAEELEEIIEEKADEEEDQ